MERTQKSTWRFSVGSVQDADRPRYYGAVPELAKRVLAFIQRQKLLQAGDRVGVAVSGGADSVGLLRLMLALRKELGIVLSVVHFNHGLRGEESEEDERFVAELAKRSKLEFRRAGGDVKQFAREKHLSVEAAARRLRYEYFAELVAQGALNRIATGHTLDDQAETVLLRLVRGAGTKGLAGIYPIRQSSVASRQETRVQPPSIIRPLLATRRKDLEAYLRSLDQPWREDGSNRDLRFARNRVRHGILPRLERGLNPAVREALAETAEIARVEEAYWEDTVSRIMPLVCKFNGRQDPPTSLMAGSRATLDLSGLLELPLALRRRVVRATCESLGLALEFKHVEETLDVADGSARAAALPHGWQATRTGDGLRIAARSSQAPADYEYPLEIPGRVAIPEAGIALEAVLIPRHAGYNPEHCLDSSLLAQDLRVRNWRSGDRFWPAHTKGPKKIKELLQDRHVLGSEKKLWPVVTWGGDIVWVRGFAVPSQFGPRADAVQVVMIREVRIEERATK
jgi:tRNA(Ile)-lysidine synthase